MTQIGRPKLDPEKRKKYGKKITIYLSEGNDDLYREWKKQVARYRNGEELLRDLLTGRRDFISKL